MVIAAVYSDVESGATDLDARSQGDAWRVLTDAGLPRDGGMADLLAEAASPAPRFAAVVCEDIERSARDTFTALRLEKELSRQGIPLFATDEPADITGVNATTVLVRRVKQGVAEWYRLQLKEKAWKGWAEHNAAGWNVGVPPYGYLAERHQHPNPMKASQGHTKTRLVADPDRRQAVADIYTWRTVLKLGVPTITLRLIADPAAYPPPADGWSEFGVRWILANPKYTGHQVFGRRRTRDGRRYFTPAEEWLWTPAPVHEPIVDLDTWRAAQDIGAEHANSLDAGDPGPNPAGRTYPYRGRVRCRDCKKRMAANPFPNHVYYRCPHNPRNPRHQAAHPGHPRTVQAPETVLDTLTGLFFRTRIFSPGRTELLARQLPASDTEAAGRRDAQAAGLAAQVRKLDAQQAAQIRALEDVPTGPPGRPCAPASTSASPNCTPSAPPPRPNSPPSPTSSPGPPPPPSWKKSPSRGTSYLNCRPPSRPACSSCSTWRSCGTRKPDSQHRSPSPSPSPTKPSPHCPRSSTPASLGTTTPPPPQTPNLLGYQCGPL